MHLSKLHRLLGGGTVALAEGEVIERIRRQDAGLHDPHLLNAPLVYNEAARCALVKLYRQYLDVGRRFDIPLLACIDTWCASKSRLERAGLAGREVNADSVSFMKEIIEAYGAYAGKVCLVRLLGGKGDAYKPAEALTDRAAAAYPAHQADRSASAGVDLLLAATRPSLPEAAGMAVALSRTGVP